MLEHKHGGIDDFIVKPLRRPQAIEVAQLEVEVGGHAKRNLVWSNPP
jgi:hypothetical protein